MTLESGGFWSESLFLVDLKTSKLILSDAICVLSWVANWVLVTAIDVLEAHFYFLHLLSKCYVEKYDVLFRVLRKSDLSQFIVYKFNFMTKHE